MLIDTDVLSRVTNVGYYDGSLLHNRFAYKFLKKNVRATGNIIAFRAPMEVITGLIDLEDSMSQDYIYSDDAINFCWEIPGIDAFGGVAFQRLFATGIANLLHQKIKAPIEMKGDDIIVHKEHTQGGVTQPFGKASVSIAAPRNGASLGHLGLNITAGRKAPAFAFSTNLSDAAASDLMHSGIELFYKMTHEIFLATTKTI